MPANAIKTIPLTLYGNSVEGLAFTVGETVLWRLLLQDFDTRLPLDLTGANVVLAFCALSFGLPTQPPLISRQATISNTPTNGTATATFAAGDTAPTPATALVPGSYGLDIFLTDASGDRLQTMTFSIVTLQPAGALPSNPITPLPSQAPLAQGPPGAPLQIVNVLPDPTTAVPSVLYILTGPTAGIFITFDNLNWTEL